MFQSLLTEIGITGWTFAVTLVASMQARAEMNAEAVQTPGDSFDAARPTKVSTP